MGNRESEATRAVIVASVWLLFSGFTITAAPMQFTDVTGGANITHQFSYTASAETQMGEAALHMAGAVAEDFNQA